MTKIAQFIFLLTMSVNLYAQNNCPADMNAPISTFCEDGKGIKISMDGKGRATDNI